MVGNYASRFYSFSMAPEGLIRTLQRNLDLRIQKGVKSIEREIVGMLNYNSDIERKEDKTTRLSTAFFEVNKAAVSLLTEFTCTEGDYVSTEWRDLFPKVLTTYRDGMVLENTDKAVFKITKMFYPKWWLEEVGYFNATGNKGGILFAPNPIRSNDRGLTGIIMTMMMVLVSCAVCAVFGFYMGTRSKVHTNTNKYQSVANYDNVQQYDNATILYGSASLGVTISSDDVTARTSPQPTAMMTSSDRYQQ